MNNEEQTASEREEAHRQLVELTIAMIAVMQRIGVESLDIPGLSFPGSDGKEFNLSVRRASPERSESIGMMLNEYQALALRTAPAPGANHFFSQSKLAEAELMQNEHDRKVAGELFRRHIDLVHAVFGMAGEAGEALDLVKKSMFYGKPLDRMKLIKEAGDCLWYIAGPFCRAVGITFEELAAQNVAKLRERYPDKYSDRAAIERRDAGVN